MSRTSLILSLIIATAASAHAATGAGRLLPLLREAARAGALMQLLRQRLLLPQRLGSRD